MIGIIAVACPLPEGMKKFRKFWKISIISAVAHCGRPFIRLAQAYTTVSMIRPDFMMTRIVLESPTTTMASIICEKEVERSSQMFSALRLSMIDVTIPPIMNTALISLRYQPNTSEPTTIRMIASAIPATITFCLPVNAPSWCGSI